MDIQSLLINYVEPIELKQFLEQIYITTGQMFTIGHEPESGKYTVLQIFRPQNIKGIHKDLFDAEDIEFIERHVEYNFEPKIKDNFIAFHSDDSKTENVIIAPFELNKTYEVSGYNEFNYTVGTKITISQLISKILGFQQLAILDFTQKNYSLYLFQNMDQLTFWLSCRYFGFYRIILEDLYDALTKEKLEYAIIDNYNFKITYSEDYHNYFTLFNFTISDLFNHAQKTIQSSNLTVFHQIGYDRYPNFLNKITSIQQLNNNKMFIITNENGVSILLLVDSIKYARLLGTSRKHKVKMEKISMNLINEIIPPRKRGRN